MTHYPDTTEVFDIARATAPTRRLALADVIDLLEVTHAPERVESYREAMRRGERFPPISVVRLAGRFFLADGHKRLAAYRPLSSGEILVEVWSTRRWIGDHLRQLRRSIQLPIRTGWRASYDTSARNELRTVFGHYADHWRRIGRSVGAKLRR